MLSYNEANFLDKYIRQYLKMSNSPINPYTVIAVLKQEGLIDEEKTRRFIEERKENIK